jgi:hypothetical protein
MRGAGIQTPPIPTHQRKIDNFIESFPTIRSVLSNGRYLMFMGPLPLLRGGFRCRFIAVFCFRAFGLKRQTIVKSVAYLSWVGLVREPFLTRFSLVACNHLSLLR